MGRSKHYQTLDVLELGRKYFCGDVSLFWSLETFEDLESSIIRDSYVSTLVFITTVLTNCKLLGDRDDVERSKDLM